MRTQPQYNIINFEVADLCCNLFLGVQNHLRRPPCEEICKDNFSANHHHHKVVCVEIGANRSKAENNIVTVADFYGKPWKSYVSHQCKYARRITTSSRQEGETNIKGDLVSEFHHQLKWGLLLV